MLQRFSTELIWALLSVVAYFLARLNAAPNYPLDRFLMSPVLLIVGVAASAWLFQIHAGNFTVWHPLLRFAVFSGIGMIAVLGFQLKGLEHTGPGALGAMIFYGFYLAIGSVIIAGLSLKFGTDVLKTAPSGVSLNALKITTLSVGGFVAVIGLLVGAVQFINSLPIGEGRAEREKVLFESKIPNSRFRIETPTPDTWKLRLSLHQDYRWGKSAGAPEPGDMTLGSVHFANRLLATPAMRKLLALPHASWTAEKVADGKNLELVAEVHLPKLNSLALQSRLEEIDRGELFPWIWLNYCLFQLPDSQPEADAVVSKRLAVLLTTYSNREAPEDANLKKQVQNLKEMIESC
ncbi:MAG: hypothetical protein EOP05_08205, partial [Proteobacteria bacterium]